jgi:integrase
LVREYLTKLQGVLGNKLTNRSRDNARRLIVSLFNFARQQGYISRDLAEEIGEIPRPKLEPVRTGVFEPAAMLALLEAGDDELRSAIAIGGFAGLRTAEIHRLVWKDVRLSERVIIVGADKAKTASRRVVPIVDNLAAWLAPLAKSEGPIVHHSHEHRLATDFCRLARRVGVARVKNGLRHSFCSYRLALTGNAPQTAYEAGNSVAMVDRHYRALVTAADGAAWFALRPSVTANAA